MRGNDRSFMCCLCLVFAMECLIVACIFMTVSTQCGDSKTCRNGIIIGGVTISSVGFVCWLAVNAYKHKKLDKFKLKERQHKLKLMHIPSQCSQILLAWDKSAALVNAVKQLMKNSQFFHEVRPVRVFRKFTVKSVYIIHNDKLIKTYFASLSKTKNLLPPNLPIMQLDGQRDAEHLARLILTIDPSMKNIYDENETYLFHATKIGNNTPKILQCGFEFSYGYTGVNGGVTLADSASEADNYLKMSYRSDSSDLCMAMVLVRTAFGRTCRNIATYTCCSDDTCFDPKCTKHKDKYDSATNLRLSRVVMPDERRCYPQIVVVYNREVGPSVDAKVPPCFIIESKNEIVPKKTQIKRILESVLHI